MQRARRRGAGLAAISTTALLLWPATRTLPGESPAPHITVVLSRDIAPYRRALAGFRKALRSERPEPTLDVIDLAGIESASGEISASTSLRRSRMIVAVGARAALSMQERHPSIPILLAGASGPEIEALLHAGSGRVFGVGLQVPLDRQFGTLRRLLPDAVRVGVLHGRDNRAEIRRARAAAGRHGMTLVPVEVASIKEIPDALADLLGGVDALWALPDATVFSAEMAPHIILQSLRARVPFMSFSLNFVRAGSLASLYCDLEDIGEQAGLMALRAMRGGGPMPSGLVPPRDVRLALNLRVAHVIGIRIPDALRTSADVLYE